MGRYYCDYCDIFLTHDSPSVRKAHNAGWKHRMQVQNYYQGLDPDKVRGIAERIVKSYEGKPGAPDFGYLLNPFPGIYSFRSRKLERRSWNKDFAFKLGGPGPGPGGFGPGMMMPRPPMPYPGGGPPPFPGGGPPNPHMGGPPPFGFPPHAGGNIPPPGFSMNGLPPGSSNLQPPNMPWMMRPPAMGPPGFNMPPPQMPTGGPPPPMPGGGVPGLGGGDNKRSGEPNGEDASKRPRFQ